MRKTNPEFIISIIVQARRQVGDVLEKAARDIDKVTKAQDKSVSSTKKVTAATNTNEAAIAKMTKSYDEYLKGLEKGNRDTDLSITHLKRFSSEFERLSKRSEAGSKAAEDLLKMARASKQLAVDIENARKQRAKQVEESYKQAKQIEDAYTDLDRKRVESARKAAVEAEAGMKKRQAFVMELLDAVNQDEARRAEERIQINKAEQEDFERIRESRLATLVASDKALEEEEKRHQKNVLDFQKKVQVESDRIEKFRKQATKDRQKADKEAADAQSKMLAESIVAREKEVLATQNQRHAQQNLRNDIDDTIRSYDDFIDRIRMGQIAGERVKVGLQQHAAALGARARQASSTFGPGTQESLLAGGRENEARGIIRDLGKESETTTRKVSGLSSALHGLFNADPQKIRRMTDAIHDLENKIGRGSFSAIKFAGTLRSLVYVGVIAFFQELVTSAIALAGALVSVASAAAQAGGALAGALAAGAAQAVPVIGLLGAAWGRVGTIFKAVQQNIKQQAQAAFDGSKAADKMRSAADGVRNAEQALADSQRRAVEAQNSLNEARKAGVRQIEDLIIAERRAQLQQGEAQRSLGEALRTGDVSSIAGLSLDVDQARIAASRAALDASSARRGGIEGLPSVVSAKSSVSDANRGVDRSRQSLKEARAEANRTVSDVSAADRTLQQMLADLSPAERRLYEVLNRVVKKYREVFTGDGGVLESITNAFTFGGERVLDLLGNDRLIKAAHDLSEAIGKELRGIFSGLSGSGTVNFAVAISEQARKNLPILVRFGTALAVIVGNIARAGGPALTKFLQFFSDLAVQGARATGSESGLTKLTEFFLKGEEYAESIVHLTTAVAELIGALIGASAAQGQNALDAITEKIREATEWIRDNRGDVKQFFSDAISASAALAVAAGHLATGLFSLFRSDRVKTFADAFTKTLLPALISVFTVIGSVTNLFLKFAGTGTGSVMLQFLIIFGGVTKILGPVVGLFFKLGQALSYALGFEAGFAFFSRLLGLLGPVGLAIAAIGTALILLNKKFHFISSFKDMFVSAQTKSKEAANELTGAINRQIEAMRRQRDAEANRKNARLSVARAEIALTRAREEVVNVDKQIENGELKGKDAAIARREASINERQATLDLKQARIDLNDAKKKETAVDADAVKKGKESVDATKKRVDALVNERDGLKGRVDLLKENIKNDEAYLKTVTPGTAEYAAAVKQLNFHKEQLVEIEDKLRGNQKDLRSEVNKGRDAFERWRNAVKRSGKNTETFGDIVNSTMEGIVNDVNQVLVEFGAKPLKWKSTRKKTKVETADATEQLRPGDTGLGGFQRGGLIPGTGDGDKVHVMAEPGEGFINKTAVKALGGSSVINAINKMIPRFARGGIVPIPGQPGELIDRRILSDVMSIIKNYKARITDGYAPSGHAAGGEHPLGLAVDIVPGPGGNWDLITKLANWAEPNQGNPRYPFRWVGYTGDSGHGEGNHLHLSWLHSGLKSVESLRGQVGMSASVLKRTISGPAGRLTDGLRGIEKRARNSANSFLDKQLQIPEFGGGPSGSGAAGTVQLRKWASEALRRTKHFSQANLLALIGRILQESGGDPNVVQRVHDVNSAAGDPGIGLGQIIGSTFEAYRDKNLPNDRRNPIANLVAVVRYMFARYGHIVGANGQGYASGGIVPGSQGQAVPIVAHANEWVVNPSQQGRLAALTGLTSKKLKSALGFSGGEGSYAGGGEVTPYSIPTDLGSRSVDIFKEIRRASVVIDKIKSSTVNSKFTDALSKSFESLLGKDGLFDRLAVSISALSSSIDRNLKSLTFSVTRAHNVIRNLSPTEIADRTVKNLLKVYQNLVREQFDIDQELAKIAQRLQDPKTNSKEKTYLKGVQANLHDRMDTITDAVNTNLEERFAAVGAAIQARIDSADTTANRGLSRVGLQDRLASILERTNIGGAFALRGQNLRTTGNILTTQRNDLISQLATADQSGQSDIAQQLRDRIDDLNVQIQENTVAVEDNTIAGIRAVSADIETRAGRRQARIDLKGRAADLLERVGNTGSAFSLRGSNLQETRGNIITQRNELFGQLGLARASGNTDLIEELADKIADLDQTLEENTVAIAENTTAARSAAIDAITHRGGFLGGVFGGLGGIVQSLGTLSGITDTQTLKTIIQATLITLGQTGSGLAQQLFEGFGLDLRGLNPEQMVARLLGTNFDAILSGLTPDQRTQFEGLISAIIDNTGATVSNTQQLNDLTNPKPQSFSSTAWQMFRTAIFNGAGGLLPQFGVNVPSLAGGADILRGGMVNVHAGERVVRAAEVRRNSNGSNGDVFNFAMTSPVEKFDPADVSRQMAFHRKNQGR